jgi:hypothetical protein
MKMIEDKMLGAMFMLVLLIIPGCSGPELEAEQQITSVESPFSTDKTLCQFNQTPCIQAVNGLSVSLMISPENTPSEKPLAVQLDLSEPVQELSVRLEGRDMFMGVIPIKLSQIAKTRYQGNLLYGSCSSNYMVWRMFISFTLRGKQQTVMFDFLADSDRDQ